MPLILLIINIFLDCSGPANLNTDNYRDSLAGHGRCLYSTQVRFVPLFERWNRELQLRRMDSVLKYEELHT